VQLANPNARKNVLGMVHDMTTTEDFYVRYSVCGGDMPDDPDGAVIEAQAPHERKWSGLHGGWLPTEDYIAV